MSIMRVLMFAASIVLASCSGGGNTQPAPLPTPLCLMTIVGVSYSLLSPADGSIGVPTTIGTMDVAVQTDPARGNNLPPPFPGATLVGSPGADVTIGAFTLIANTPVVGGGGSVVGNFVATVPTLAAHTTYSVSVLTHAGCPQTIGSFTTL